jgi:D-3-phosphoglycerate dehydrogenase
MVDIIISEVINWNAVEILKKEYDVYYDPKLYLNSGALADMLAHSVALIVRNQTKVDKELLCNAPKLKVIGRLGSGLDNIDLFEAEKRGIQVVYAPEGNSLATAEHTIALIFALARNISNASAAIRQGIWDRKAYTGVQIAGKTLGVIGYGRVGKLVAQKAESLGMNILVHRRQSGGILPNSLASQVSLTTLLTNADFVSLHVPLTQLTNGLIGAPELALMKPSAYIINTSRGLVIREKDLYAALVAGKIAGAALDVREKEPPAVESELHNLPNVLLTPHIGGWTNEAQETVAYTVANDVLKVLSGKEPSYPYLFTHRKAAQDTNYPAPMQVLTG